MDEYSTPLAAALLGWTEARLRQEAWRDATAGDGRHPPLVRGPSSTRAAATWTAGSVAAVAASHGRSAPPGLASALPSPTWWADPDGGPPLVLPAGQDAPGPWPTAPDPWLDPEPGPYPAHRRVPGDAWMPPRGTGVVWVALRDRAGGRSDVRWPARGRLLISGGEVGPDALTGQIGPYPDVPVWDALGWG